MPLVTPITIPSHFEVPDNMSPDTVSKEGGVNPFAAPLIAMRTSY